MSPKLEGGMLSRDHVFSLKFIYLLIYIARWNKPSSELLRPEVQAYWEEQVCHMESAWGWGGGDMTAVLRMPQTLQRSGNLGLPGNGHSTCDKKKKKQTQPTPIP